MALEGTIKTPFGPLQKKTALIGGGALVLVGGIVWYRQKQTAAQPDAFATDAEINPATGFPYGSAEDAAALAAQAAYISASPTGASGGGNTGGSGSSTTPVLVTNNAEWTQAVLAYFQDNGIIEDVSAMALALGKYLSGTYVSDADVALIQQATAVKGQPPVAGASGYPPSLNRTPPGGGTTNPPPGGGTTNPPPGGGTTTPPPVKPAGNAGPLVGRKTTWTDTTVTVTWKSAANAITYRVYRNGNLIATRQGPFTLTNLTPKTHYTIGVQAVAKNGSLGPVSNTTFWTKAKGKK